MTAPALELRAIDKRFGPVHALCGADFSLQPGEVHALLGENGAGKSTLMHIAYGLLSPDSGTIAVRGRPAVLRTPRDARRLGIGMVHQHFTSIPALTVEENLALAAGWRVAAGALRERVVSLIDRVGLPLDPAARAESLSAGLKQRLEILKALAADTTILLLDEPTAVLAPAEVGGLLRVVRGFADAGGAAVLITHKLDEALRAADRVTVLRAGRVTLVAPAATETPATLATAMIGSSAALIAHERPAATAAAGPVLVRCIGLEIRRDDGRGPAVRDASLVVAAGELVGVAAIEGNGQRELLRAIAGVVPVVGGSLEVAEPVAFIPEDRTSEGLIPELSLTENIVLGLGRAAPWVRRGRLDWSAARARTGQLIGQFGIRAPGPDVPAAALSGGNQQKVVIARVLERKPRVIVAENPTRGLDIQAARAVWQRLRAAAVGGAAVLAYSTDLDEVLAEADRVLVIANGRVGAAPDGAGRAEVGTLMLGGGPAPAESE